MQQHKSQVQDWMSREPVTVRPDTSAYEAYDLMRQRKVRRLPVVGRDGGLVGIVTRSDIEQAMPAARGEQERRHAAFELAGTMVDELMTREPITITPETPIYQAAETINKAKVSGLPVVSNGRLVGIITESDIFRLVVEMWRQQEAQVD